MTRNVIPIFAGVKTKQVHQTTPENFTVGPKIFHRSASTPAMRFGNGF